MLRPRGTDPAAGRGPRALAAALDHRPGGGGVPPEDRQTQPVRTARPPARGARPAGGCLRGDPKGPPIPAPRRGVHRVASRPRAKPWGEGGIPESFAFEHLPADLGHIEPLFASAMQRVPALESAGVQVFFNGPESFTPDDRYLLGETPEMRGLYVAAGFNSIG